MAEVTVKKIILKNKSGEYLIPYTDMSDYYTKTEIDELIGSIENLLSEV